MKLLAFDFDVVKVLGYGLSGFAFLLMFFAFMLLRQVISKDKETNNMIFKSIWGFMGLSLIMTLCIGLFSFFVQDYKQQQLADSNAIISEQKGKIGILVDDKQRDSLMTEAITSKAYEDPNKFKQVKEKQEKILDSLGTKINNSSAATDQDKKDFSNTKTEISHISSQLVKADLPAEKRDSLSKQLVNLNRKISTISEKVVKTPNTAMMNVKSKAIIKQ